MIDWKEIKEFYLTLAVPLLYGLNLWLVSMSGGLDLSDTVRILGLILGVVGILLWILSYLGLGRSFGVLPKKQKKVKRGVYAFLNHPMYLGIMLCFVGLGVANLSARGVGFSLLVMLPFLWWRARLEEGKLVDESTS